MTDNKEPVGERIKQARKHLGYTQNELAQKSGLAQQTITKLEASAISRPRKILELSKALECTPEWLMFGMHPPRWMLTSRAEEVSSVNVSDRILVFEMLDENTLSEEPCGYAYCLSQDKDAYGIRLKGNQKIAGFRDGNILVAEPNFDIGSNDNVVCQVDGEPICIGVCIDSTEDTLTVVCSATDGVPLTMGKSSLKFFARIGSSWSPSVFVKS
jgi:transcriptional regulator with XRE-family HTH domain